VRAPNHDFPELQADLTIPHLNQDRAAGITIRRKRAQGHLIRVQWGIDGLLPSAMVQALFEVSLLIEKADRHEWQTQITGLLRVVTG